MFYTQVKIENNSNYLKKLVELKEKELVQKEEAIKREEWLSSLRRMCDNNLVDLLNNTPKMIEPVEILNGGMGSKPTIFRLPKEYNQKYIDIENECVIRGIIEIAKDRLNFL